MGETPWAGLDHLAEDMAIPDLRELAASVTLAGDSGAKIRTSLAAKARALRTKSLADVEEAAQAATERMSLPRWEGQGVQEGPGRRMGGRGEEAWERMGW